MERTIKKIAFSTSQAPKLTILASYAEEESLSASENQKWRIKRNFENGMPWNGTLLGYRYKNGKYILVPNEAIIPLQQFNAVQEEIKRRAEKHTHPSVKQKVYPFTGKIVCGNCEKQNCQLISAMTCGLQRLIMPRSMQTKLSHSPLRTKRKLRSRCKKARSLGRNPSSEHFSLFRLHPYRDKPNDRGSF